LLRYQLDNAGAEVAIVDSRYRDAVHQVCADGSLRIFEASELPHAEGSVETVVDVAAVGAVLYTSGTTGQSKGVMLSHHQQTSFGRRRGRRRGPELPAALPHRGQVPVDQLLAYRRPDGPARAAERQRLLGRRPRRERDELRSR